MTKLLVAESAQPGRTEACPGEGGTLPSIRDMELHGVDNLFPSRLKVRLACWLLLSCASIAQTPDPKLSEQWRSLPLSPGLWGALGFLESSAITEPLDFGGLSSARLSLYSKEAGSWVSTAYRLNGRNLSDPYQPGRVIFMPDLATVESVEVEYDVPPLMPPLVGLVARSAEPQWRGAVSSWFAASALASDNRPPEAGRAGLARPEQFRWFTRDNIQVGGPLGRRADILFSGTGQWASQRQPRQGLSERFGSRLLFGALKGRFQAGSADQIRGALHGTRIDLDDFGIPVGFEPLAGRRISPPFSRFSGLREENHMDSVQAGWTRTPKGARLEALQVRYGYTVAHLDTWPETPAEPTRIELLDGTVRGTPPLWNLALRTRHQVDGTLKTGPLSWRSSTLRLSGGAGWERAGSRNRLRAHGDRHAILAGNRALSVLLLNTPSDSRARLHLWRAHMTGALDLASWLSFSGRFLFERSGGGAPEEDADISWNAASPRVAVSIAPPWRFEPALRISYARYYYPLALRYLDFIRPGSLSGEEFQWLDANGDQMWQPGETGSLLRRFGGAYSSADPSLKPPIQDEIAVEAAADLPANIRGQLRMFRRDDRRRLAALNTGVPFEPTTGAPSYLPVNRLDPGPDFIAGTFDDQTLTIFQQDPATFGRDRFLLANTSLRSFSAGLSAALRGRGARYHWRLSFTAEKGYGPTNFGNNPWENDPASIGSLLQDPNELINATGRVFFDRAFTARFHGVYRLPEKLGGLDLGGVAAYWDGLPFARKLLVEDLPQGPVVVQATPRGSPEGGHRTEFNLTLDLRIARDFSLGPGTLRLLADVFNLTNVDNSVHEADVSGLAFNERLPVAIQPPRFVRLGFEFRF